MKAKHSRTVEEYLLMLDPLVVLDDGPNTIRMKDGTIVTGYHQDPYGVHFRNDARLSMVVNLVGWDAAVKVKEIGDLVQKTAKMLDAYDLDLKETRERQA
ncbi:hypothetical protein [Streptomyces sp. 5-10]|uniref:hypothetical protein n=1 Tax=Streptomyces sp. 5-10 TaxID=878925 RepID=UPI00168B201A|nr:hypothetical protein [Streptomyces sp. 5-10]MBD3004578.1 hypothetical protein [Streptomyces sp. 5-10]